MPDPVYIKHRVYWDGSKTYRCKYSQMLTRNSPEDNYVLTFRLLENAWVLIRERGFYTETDSPGMIERFEHATGIRATQIIYAFGYEKPEVLEAEWLALGEEAFIDAAPIIDLASS